jgi:hypothetical protein
MEGTFPVYNKNGNYVGTVDLSDSPICPPPRPEVVIPNHRAGVRDRNGVLVGSVVVSGFIPESVANPHPRANHHWTEFEHENLRKSFDDFVKHRSMKQGRTEMAILSRLRKFIPGPYSG